MGRLDQTTFKFYEKMLKEHVTAKVPFEDIIEEFVLNDEDFAKYEISNQSIICGLLAFYINNVLKSDVNDQVVFFDKAYVLGLKPREAIFKFFARYYKWDGTNYYKYNDTECLWEKCEFDMFPLGKGISCDLSIPSINFKVWKIGVASIEKYIQSIFSARFDENEIRAHIQSTITKFDVPNNIVYTKVNYFNLSTKTLGTINRTHRITSKLNYTPELRSRDTLTHRYLKGLRVSREPLQVQIAKIADNSDTVTIITGPPGSGKTTLCKIIQNLYADRPGQTVYFDENKIDYAKIQSYPGRQIVCTTTSDAVFDFDDRPVVTIQLIGSVKSPDETIADQMNCPDEKSQLLAMCLKSYDSSSSSTSSTTSTSALQSLLRLMVLGELLS